MQELEGAGLVCGRRLEANVFRTCFLFGDLMQGLDGTLEPNNHPRININELQIGSLKLLGFISLDPLHS